MINYIKAELYRTFSSKTIYVFLGVIFGFSILLNASNYYYTSITHNKLHSKIIYTMNSTLKSSNSMAFLVTMIFSFIIIREYSQSTFKNIISSNLSRRNIYLGKLITINILNIGIYLAFVLVNTMLALILFKIDSSLTLNSLFDFIKHIIYALPVYIGISSLGCFMAFSMKKDGIFITVYFICYMFISNIITYISYKYNNPKIAEINNYLIFPSLDIVTNFNVTSVQTIRAFLVGLGFTVVFGVLGYVVFKRQDIK